jgi:predicted  nucleic acid-binding Zn-ribbon protein
MSLKQDFTRQVQAQIEVWQAQIKDHQEQLAQAGAKGHADYEKTMAQMKANAEQARELLEQVQEANERAWNDMQAATQKAFVQLQKGWADALSHFV